jgi:hypothetical protein
MVMQAAWSCDDKPTFVLISQDILDNLSRTCHNMRSLFVHRQVIFHFLRRHQRSKPLNIKIVRSFHSRELLYHFIVKMTRQVHSSACDRGFKRQNKKLSQTKKPRIFAGFFRNSPSVFGEFHTFYFFPFPFAFYCMPFYVFLMPGGCLSPLRPWDLWKSTIIFTASSGSSHRAKTSMSGGSM